MEVAKIHTFKDATAVKALTSHTYSAEFHPEWCIGSGTSTFLTLPHPFLPNTSPSTPRWLRNLRIPPRRRPPLPHHPPPPKPTPPPNPPPRISPPHSHRPRPLHRLRRETRPPDIHPPHHPHPGRDPRRGRRLRHAHQPLPRDRNLLPDDLAARACAGAGELRGVEQGRR